MSTPITDTFQWTDDTVKEFMEWLPNHQVTYKTAIPLIETFKASKQAKEWEIVSFKSHRMTDMVWSLKDGKYSNNYGAEFSFDQLMNDQDTGACVADGRMYIHSVRRLSDNAVFEVGERIREGFIKSFAIDGDNMQAWFDHGGGKLLKDIEKLPDRQLVLTTHDGVKKYKGENCIRIDTEGNWGISTWYALPYPLKMFCEGNPVDISGYVFFSTRSAAEEYVRENKPCISRANIRKALHSFPSMNYIIDLIDKQIQKGDTK